MIVAKVLRIPNLLIVAATIWILAQYSLYPALQSYDVVPALSSKDVLALIFVTICIAAAGYLQNDIYDLRTDELNDRRGYLNRTSITISWVLYWGIVLLPLPIVYMLASEISKPSYMMMYPTSIIILHLYNRYLKHFPLIGNVVIATLCAAVVGLPLLAETDGVRYIYSADMAGFRSFLSIWSAYALFAFITTLCREIVKDSEDLGGDQETGSRTLPIAIGLKATRMVLLILQSTAIGGVLVWTYQASLWVSSVGLLIIPGIYILYRLWTVSDDYSDISLAYKAWMLLGLIYLVIYLSSI